MTIEIPEVDLKSMTKAELNAHADICAHASNLLRAHSMAVHGEIINRVNAEHAEWRASGASVAGLRLIQGPAQKPTQKPAQKVRSVKEILGDDNVEDLFTMDDFR